MGINDPIKFEDKFVTMAPRAYRYRLPHRFCPSVVIYDLNQLQMASFQNIKNKDANDYIRALNRPIIKFATSDVLAPLKTKLEAQAYETLDAETAPSAEDLRKLREETPQVFDYPYAALDATLVYCRDDSRYIPRARDLVHEERYEKRPTLTEEMIRDKGIHIVDDRPLPGYNYQGELAEDGRTIRQYAGSTPMIRAAYQNYGAWRLAESIKEITSELSAEAMARAHHRRRVLIDSVLEHFPIDLYRSTPLCYLPRDWAKGRRVMRYFSLTTDEEEASLQPPAIGEGDLKCVWYAENLAKDGDEVLIRSNDSDIVFIFLMHARRFVARNIRVWLDMNSPNMNEKRYTRRFVCINELYEGILKHASEHWPGMENPAEVLVFLALTTGSDYTTNPYQIGPTKILEHFFGKAEGWRALKTLVAPMRIEWEAVLADEADGGPWERPISIADLDAYKLLHVDENVALDFMRHLYQLRITQGTLNKHHIASASSLSWSDLRKYIDAQAEGKKTADDLKLPALSAISAEIRRVVWVMHNWANAHVARGAFPSSELEEHDGGSIWGWTILPKRCTKNSGDDRCAAALLPIEHRQREAQDRGRPEEAALVVAKSIAVVNVTTMQAWFLAEALARVDLGDEHLRLKLPFWHYTHGK